MTEDFKRNICEKHLCIVLETAKNYEGNYLDLFQEGLMAVIAEIEKNIFSSPKTIENAINNRLSKYFSTFSRM